MNYAANQYSFRQDSTFLYYWGLDTPGLAATLDVESGTETLFGDDPTIADIVWTGPQPLVHDRAETVGIHHTAPKTHLGETLRTAVRKGCAVHYLPPYRAENILLIEELLGVHPSFVREYASDKFAKAVVAQRSIKGPEEIAEIEKAVNVTCEMQIYAMRMASAGKVEREIVGPMHGIAVGSGGNLAFPIIFSVHGETLHNHQHDNPDSNPVVRAHTATLTLLPINARTRSKSSIVSTPIDGDFASTTLIFTPRSRARNCSSDSAASAADCGQLVNFRRNSRR